MTNQSKGKLRLHVKLENWVDESDDFTHISQWSLSKEHEKTLTSILRQLFEHPETKYSSRLKRLDK
jgi:hypothetical protein